ncbi:hypothetical protein ACQP1P_22800 [Dactylosporangium sp. CA-052675]|uniref:hypothetical protein n=1 Tax=Dactylosporangium sp. CA-052675 TaxID=3239927 RepID=UPI003D8A4719
MVYRGSQQRRATAAGRDIYAVTAPLAVEAVARILTGRARTTGAASAGAMFDAPDFLAALAPDIAVSAYFGRPDGSPAAECAPCSPTSGRSR